MKINKLKINEVAQIANKSKVDKANHYWKKFGRRFAYQDAEGDHQIVRVK